MTRVEKIILGILILALIITAVFWKDIRNTFVTDKEIVADDEFQNEKGPKETKDKDKKNKKDKKDNKEKDKNKEDKEKDLSYYNITIYTV
jgi:flagellar biosynthesis/type III secretory pathway M-ring protein FliF/YscJ